MTSVKHQHDSFIAQTLFWHLQRTPNTFVWSNAMVQKVQVPGVKVSCHDVTTTTLALLAQIRQSVGLWRASCFLISCPPTSIIISPGCETSPSSATVNVFCETQKIKHATEGSQRLLQLHHREHLDQLQSWLLERSSGCLDHRCRTSSEGKDTEYNPTARDSFYPEAMRHIHTGPGLTLTLLAIQEADHIHTAPTHWHLSMHCTKFCTCNT